MKANNTQTQLPLKRFQTWIKSTKWIGNLQMKWLKKVWDEKNKWDEEFKISKARNK